MSDWAVVRDTTPRGAGNVKGKSLSGAVIFRRTGHSLHGWYINV